MNDSDDTIPLLRQGAAGDQHALGAALGPLPGAAQADGPPAAGPPPPGPARPLRRPPGGVPRLRPAGRRVRRNPEVSFFLWLRTLTGQRLQCSTGSTSGPRCATRPGDLAPSRADAAGHQRLAGRPAPGAASPRPRRGRPGRDADPAPGGPQRPGPDRPRGPGPAPLRGAVQRRDGPGPGDRPLAASSRHVRAPEAARARSSRACRGSSTTDR